MGNRHTDNTVSVTARAAINMAAGLRLIADEYDRLAKAMGDKEIIEAASLITGMEGLARIAKFCGSVQEAYCLAHALESAAEDIAGAQFAMLSRIERLKDEAIAAKVAEDAKGGSLLNVLRGLSKDEIDILRQAFVALDDEPPPGTPRGTFAPKRKRAEKKSDES